MNRKKQKHKLVAEINVVPYIDVTLVLMVIFMITAPLLMQGVKVELPQANSSPMDSDDQEPFIVSIKSDGTYWIDEKGINKSRPLNLIKDRVSPYGCTKFQCWRSTLLRCRCARNPRRHQAAQSWRKAPQGYRFW